MLKFPAPLFLEGLVLGSLLECPAASACRVEEVIQEGKGNGEQRELPLSLQQLETGDEQVSLRELLSFACEPLWPANAQVEESEVISGGLIGPPRVGALALILAVQIMAWGFSWAFSPSWAPLASVR